MYTHIRATDWEHHPMNLFDSIAKGDFTPLADEAPAAAPARRVTLAGDTVTFSFDYDPALVAAVKAEVEGRRWNAATKSWTAPLSESAVAFAREHGFAGADEVAAAFAPVAERQEALREASVAIAPKGEVEVVGADRLYAYQQAGAEAVILNGGRGFIGDQMGLGKTRQAIAVVETQGSHPALVVCPAAVKEGWAREVAAVAPERTVAIAQGRTVDTDALDADYIVVNYDVLQYWAEALAPVVRALIVDESHKVKNAKALRTQATFTIRDAMPEGSPVILLTGTPVVNRPLELITQLDLAGMLEQVVTPRKGTAKKDYEWAFKFEYCGPVKDGGYWEFKGSSNLDTLNAKMRAAGYIRRLKADVLADLPQKDMPVRVSLSLNGALAAYRREEEAIANSDDIAIAQMTRLRVLAAEAKYEASIEWIRDWQEANPGEPLLVFAHHRAIQERLASDLNALHLGGGMKPEARTEVIDAFNRNDNLVLVGSIKALAEGVNLQHSGCSAVVFVEMDWTPGAHQQAEDRIHRIGQTEVVTPFYLVAEETFDADMYEVIEAKATTIAGATDGFDVETEDSLIQFLIERLKGRH